MLLVLAGSGFIVGSNCSRYSVIVGPDTARIGVRVGGVDVLCCAAGTGCWVEVEVDGILKVLIVEV